MWSVRVSLIQQCRSLGHTTIAEPAAVVAATTSADRSIAGKWLQQGSSRGSLPAPLKGDDSHTVP